MKKVELRMNEEYNYKVIKNFIWHIINNVVYYI